MQAMVNFIYSDELPGIHELAGSFSMWTSTAIIQHLLAAADRYGLDRLRILCEAKLCDELTSETVATTLALAEQHHCAQLKSACLKFTAVRQNLGGIPFFSRIYVQPFVDNSRHRCVSSAFSICLVLEYFFRSSGV
jgi:speckle-type POZ protein